jgi:hypothetical protein
MPLSSFQGLKPRPPLPRGPPPVIPKLIEVYHPGYTPQRLILKLFVCPLNPRENFPATSKTTADAKGDDDSENEGAKGGDNDDKGMEDEDDDLDSDIGNPDSRSYYGLPTKLVLQACAVLANNKEGTLYDANDHSPVGTGVFLVPGTYIFCLGIEFSDAKYGSGHPVPHTRLTSGPDTLCVADFKTGPLLPSRLPISFLTSASPKRTTSLISMKVRRMPAK